MTCSARCAATAGCSSTRRSSRSRSEGQGVVVYLRGHEGRGHRARPQAAGVHAPGPGSRHGRGERGPRVPGRLPRVRHRVADPRGPRHHDDAPDDEQPGEVRRPRGLRARDRRAGPGLDHRRPTRTSRTCARSRRRWGTSSTSRTKGSEAAERCRRPDSFTTERLVARRVERDDEPFLAAMFEDPDGHRDPRRAAGCDAGPRDARPHDRPLGPAWVRHLDPP